MNMQIRIVTATLALFVATTAAAQTPPDAYHIAFSVSGGAVANYPTPLTNPVNPAIAFTNQTIALVDPSSTATNTAYAISDTATWAAWLGDSDGDGNYAESIILSVDAIDLPAGSRNPPTIFDFLVSFQNDIGSTGALNGVLVRDGDVVRLRPGGGVTPFMTETQFISAIGNLAPTTFDIDAFAIDPATDDIYFSVDADTLVAGFTLRRDGDLYVIRSSNYTLGANGSVTSVVPGSAQVALAESAVNARFTAAGLTGGLLDLKAIEIDPRGGTFTSSAGVCPNLLFCGDNTAHGATIVSTVGGGTVFSLQGDNNQQIVFNNPLRLGILNNPGSFQFNTIANLAIGVGFLETTPRFLDTDSVGYQTPGVLRLDMTGLAPNAPVLLLARHGTTSPSGTITSRLDIDTVSFPGINLDRAGGFRELYLIDPADSIFNLSLSLPALIADANGRATRTFNVPFLNPGIGFCFQAFDTSNTTLTTPVIPVTIFIP